MPQEPGSEQRPRDDEPGGASTPQDTSGDGPVGLEDRTAPGGKGSPGSNQGKAEPIAPTPGHPDPTAPLTPPLLEDMNVGAADPQAPSHPAAGDAPLPVSASAPSGPAHEARSHRAPGLQGAPSPAERVETDLAAGAAAMRPGTGAEGGTGEVHGVPVPSETPSPGTSESSDVVRGARQPGSG